MKKIILLTFFCVFMFSSAVFAAPFASSSNGPAVMVGEVHCYGQYDLSQFVDRLQIEISEKLQDSDKFHVVGGTPDSALMKQVHMNAIVRGHLYDRGVSGPELIKYANSVLGKSYRPTDAEIEAKMKLAGTSYSLSPDVAAAVKDYAEREGVDYLLFANLNYVEVWLRNSIFTVNTSDAFRGKSVATNVEYYLVNAKTGMVYDGVSKEKTTAEQVNMFLLSYGKGMDMGMVVSGIMDKHVKAISKKIASNGIKALQ